MTTRISVEVVRVCRDCKHWQPFDESIDRFEKHHTANKLKLGLCAKVIDGRAVAEEGQLALTEDMSGCSRPK
jgi:hypothetical protein